MLTPYESARARGQAYGLCGRLFLWGLTADLLSRAAEIPEMIAALPYAYDPDEAAAEHQALFGFNVFPYQSSFLDPSGLLGGVECDGVRQACARAGFAADESSDSPDHIGRELMALAFLCGAEADALQDEHQAVVKRTRELQAAFLDEHLLWWLPLFVQAVIQQDSAFFTSLVTLTEELVLDHRAALVATEAGIPLHLTTQPTTTARLPEAPDPLTEERTGLREIAEFLLKPAYSGIYLSRDDIGRLARKAGLPRGFGERRQMLTNLLRAAAEYDQLPRVLAELQSIVDAYESALRAYRETASGAAIAGQWLQRQTLTRRVVATLAKAARNDVEA